MTVATAATAQSVARAFAEIVRDEPIARRLWLQLLPEEFVLWLVTDDADWHTQRRLYEAESAIRDRFPDAPFRFHVLSPRMVEGDPVSVVPRDATEVALRTS